jgi:hypothetical protein
MKDNWDKVKDGIQAAILLGILVLVIVIVYKVATQIKGGETEIVGGDGRAVPRDIVAMTANNAPRSITITFVPVGPLSTSQRVGQTTAAEAA